MKYLLAFVVGCVLFSCSDGTTKTQPHSSSQQTIINDSTLIKKEAANPYVQVDVSPMDMAYLPADFPLKKMNGEEKGWPVARVAYSRPHRGGRKLFGELVKWGQPWRLGANEATEIELFKAVTIQGKRVEPGKYILYAIPFEDKWTIIFNRNIYVWGLKFDHEDDAHSFDIPTQRQPQLIEHFTMYFQATASGAQLIMAWENTEARLPLEY